MIREMDLVVLNHDISEHGLKVDDLGTVVHCYKGNATFEKAPKYCTPA